MLDEIQHFEMLVPSRVAAKCRVKGQETLPTLLLKMCDLPELLQTVLDWDRLGKSDKLGSGMIDLVNIEPFQATKQTVKLATSDGVEHGSIDIRMVFRPEVSS